MSENGKPEPRVRIPKAGGHNSASGPSEPRKPAAESFLIRAAGTLFHLLAALSRPAGAVRAAAPSWW